jgi:hypothetical protein
LDHHVSPELSSFCLPPAQEWLNQLLLIGRSRATSGRQDQIDRRVSQFIRGLPYKQQWFPHHMTHVSAAQLAIGA